MHWRWGANLERDNPVGAQAVSPRFNNNAGRPFIPPGSNQDVDIAIVIPDSNEQRPGPDQSYQDSANNELISSSDDSIRVPLSFWYSATGHSNQDSFMLHGGFFSSLRVTISNPYIFVNNAIFPFPVQSFLGCSTIIGSQSHCVVSSKITNQTGHMIRWTATILDKNTGNTILESTEEISGAVGQAVPGLATIELPGGAQILPTYLLRVRVVDETTLWQTEREAYLTQGGVTFIRFIP